MNERTFETLELDSLRALLAGHVQSPLGRERAAQLLPSADADLINRELDRTSECVNYLTTGGVFGLGGLTDVAPSLELLHVAGASLDPHQILELQSVLNAAVDLRGQFLEAESQQRYPQLARLTNSIPDLRPVLSAIRGKILPSGEVDDAASPALRRIRREINDRRGGIYRSLESMMRDSASAAIQEDIVTIRNGRFVIPVRTEARGQVHGVMHGLSSSGQTTFVEPLAVIEQNNELVRLREEEEIEIARVLLAISNTLRSQLAGIRAAVDAISDVDFIQAKARFAIDLRCVRPVITPEIRLLAQEARHPLLESSLRRAGGKVVPISFEMETDRQTMVISGPNAGGKTVALKTVGLLALMTQMGLHVPATRFEMPAFRHILADIGDQQSIAANLSTFTAHMRNVAEMATLFVSPALILLDEVGTGTDPDEGAALGIAIIDYFRRHGATTITTTHYNPVKMWASQTDGVLNASFEFDEKTLTPTFRLLVGIAGASAGIEIARRMMLPSGILSDAVSRLDPVHLQANDYLARLKALAAEAEAQRNALEDERQATADKYAHLDLEFARKEAARRNQFEVELADALRAFSSAAEQQISGIRDKVTAARLKKDVEARTAELRRAAAAQLKKSTTSATVVMSPAGDRGGATEPQPQPPIPSTLDLVDFHERDRVRISSLNLEGTIESVADDTYVVLVGSLRFRAKRSELVLVTAAGAAPLKARQLPRGVSAELGSHEGFVAELNVIGRATDEAADRVDKFLDEAFLAGAQSVRIIHGHGTGALRRAIAGLLSGHPHVKSFHPAPPAEGGSGATIAELNG